MSWMKKAEMDTKASPLKAKTLADSALFAFYTKLVEMAPEIQNWDLDPFLEKQLHDAAEQAIQSLLPKEPGNEATAPEGWTDELPILDESNLFQ